MKTDVSSLNTKLTNLKQSFQSNFDKFGEQITDRVNELNDDLSSVETDVEDLKERIENSKADKISTVRDRCRNCKNNPCLNGKSITKENVVGGAKFTSRCGSGYTKIDGYNKFIYWDYGSGYADSFEGTIKTLALKYSCGKKNQSKSLKIKVNQPLKSYLS